MSEEVHHGYVVTWEKQHSEGWDEEAVACYDLTEVREWVKSLKEEKWVARIQVYSLNPLEINTEE